MNSYLGLYILPSGILTLQESSADWRFPTITFGDQIMTHSIYRMDSAHALPAPVQLPRMAAAATLAFAAAILAGCALSAPLPGAAAAWGGVALAAWCTALLLACSLLAHREGLGLAQWKLGSWFLAWCAVTCGLASIPWVHPQTGLLAQILPSSVGRAEWMTAVAAAAWAAGYCVGPPKPAIARATRLIRHEGVVRSALTPWLLYGTGTMARVAGAVLTGHLGYAGNASLTSAPGYEQALGLAALACPLAIATAGLRVFRDRAPGAGLTLAVLLAAETAAGAVMGGKGTYVTAVMAVAVARASAGRGMPRRLILAAAAFFLLIVIPFTATYRDAVRGPAITLSPAAAASAVPALAGSAAGNAGAGTIATSADYLTQRLSEISSPAIMMQKTPSQIPYLSPVQTFESVAAGLIPRALWPGKPVLDAGYQFSQEYYGTPPAERTSAAITPEADLWRYGGWAPVIAGMAFLGWLVRVLDDVLDIRASPAAALLIVLLWPVVATPEGSFTGILVAIPGLILTWLVVYAATFGRRGTSVFARPAG